MNTLDLSGKINEDSIEIYSAIDNAAKILNIPYVVVGAAARDLVLHYGYGARIKRITADIDFGIQVPDWQTFEAIRDILSGEGFREDKTWHRLFYKAYIIDLVPFGAIQNEEAKIAWPPNEDVVMNVMGFHEVVNNATQVTLQEEPVLIVPVASCAGLSILKMICWTDRAADLKNKDAKDLLFLFKSYEQIPEIKAAIYDYLDVMQGFDWDISLASAFKLGVDAALIAKKETKQYLAKIKNNEINKRSCETLVEDMCEDIEEEYVFNEKLLNAYFQGLNYNNKVNI